ncbi:hypothetical protein VTP01DRAFT_6957 [Rhizomucor pusillus]|uniref:uncharacterized protein n=1 Tax=Rhizomucor pusillus TaxID=4840 RepID=UPI0037432316
MATTSTQTIELKSLNATDSSLALKAFVSEATSILQHRRPRDAAFTLEQGPDDTLPDPLSLNSSRISEKDITEVKRRKVQKFYRQQNEQIDHLLSPLNSDNNEDHEKQILKVKIAVYGSGMANVILFVLQIVAAVFSDSLAIFATMSDAFMDLLSSVVMMWMARQVARPNPIKYPAGKARMETAAIMVVSCLMSCVAIFLIIEAAKRLATGGNEGPNMSTLSIAMVSTALGVKFLLMFYCMTLRNYASARLFAQDHRNDILVNSLGLITGILGSRIASWIDPVGSILVALVILRSWVSTLIEHTQLIIGKTADVSFLQPLTHPGVCQVDTCRAYYAGENLYVEVDIVLPPEMPLRDSHDIAESLQIKLESIPSVERAFVHADYETSHRPEHQKTK